MHVVLYYSDIYFIIILLLFVNCRTQLSVMLLYCKVVQDRVSSCMSLCVSVCVCVCVCAPASSLDKVMPGDRCELVTGM